MNSAEMDQSVCDNFSFFNETQLHLPHLPDETSCLFWMIVHNKVLLFISVVLILIFISFTLVVNIYLLLGLKNSEALSWQPRYMLLKNLILSDLLQSLALAPSMLYCLINHQTLSFGGWCLLQHFTVAIANVTSLFTVFLMAMERFVYICHGIHYLTIMTNTRIYICLMLIWLLALTVAITGICIIVSGSPRFGQNIAGLICEPGVILDQVELSVPFETFSKLIMVILMFLAVFVFLFAYCHMYQKAKQALQPFQQDNIRARRTVAFYLGIFILQLFPVTFLFVTMFGEKKDYHLFVALLFLVPPCVNPLAYGYRNKEVQQALVRLCGFKLTVVQPVTDGTLCISFTSS